MNIVIGVLAIIFSTYFGSLISKKFTERKIFYSDFYEFNKRLKREINFSQKTILDIIKENKKIKTLFYDYLHEEFILKIEKDFTSNIIDSDETRFLIDYVKTIGNSDIKTQSEFIESVDLYLKEKLNIAIEEEKRNKKTYIKLGFLIGLIILVILL